MSQCFCLSFELSGSKKNDWQVSENNFEKWLPKSGWYSITSFDIMWFKWSSLLIFRATVVNTYISMCIIQTYKFTLNGAFGYRRKSTEGDMLWWILTDPAFPRHLKNKMKYVRVWKLYIWQGKGILVNFKINTQSQKVNRLRGVKYILGQNTLCVRYDQNSLAKCSCMKDLFHQNFHTIRFCH